MMLSPADVDAIASIRGVLERTGISFDDDDLQRDLLVAFQRVVKKHVAKAEREAARAAAKAEREAAKAAAKAEREAAKAAAKVEREAARAAAKIFKKAAKTKLPDDELIPDSDMDGDTDFRRLTPPAFELVADREEDDEDEDEEYRMWAEFRPRV